MAFDDYFDEKLYRMQNTPEVKEVQLHKLRQHLTKFYNQSPAVKAFVDSQGVAPDKITFEVFRQAFPLLGQDTMRGSVAAEGAKQPGFVVDMMAGMLGIDPTMDNVTFPVRTPSQGNRVSSRSPSIVSLRPICFSTRDEI